MTFDDAMDVMEDEATEDMEKMAAMLPSEHPYMRSTPVEIWKNRIPWLLLLMVSATLTGIVITKFEDSLAVLPCLTAFIPMLMDTGGNSGSQACVSIIRGISLNEIEFRDLGQRRLEGDPRVGPLRRVSGGRVLCQDRRCRHAAAEERERHATWSPSSSAPPWP